MKCLKWDNMLIRVLERALRALLFEPALCHAPVQTIRFMSHRSHAVQRQQLYTLDVQISSGGVHVLRASDRL